MQSDTSKPALLAVFILATFSSAALAQSENRPQIMIKKAPPKEQSKYIGNAGVQTTALPYRYNAGRMRTTPGYITPEPRKSTHAASAVLLEDTGSLPHGR